MSKQDFEKCTQAVISSQSDYCYSDTVILLQVLLTSWLSLELKQNTESIILLLCNLDLVKSS